MSADHAPSASDFEQLLRALVKGLRGQLAGRDDRVMGQNLRTALHRAEEALDDGR